MQRRSLSRTKSEQHIERRSRVKETKTRAEADLGRLDSRPKTSDLLLNPRVHLSNLEFLPATLFPHSSLLQVEVQPDVGLRPIDLLAEPLLQLLDIGQEAFVLGFDHRQVVLLRHVQLGLELREVDLLLVLMLQKTHASEPKMKKSFVGGGHAFS